MGEQRWPQLQRLSTLWLFSLKISEAQATHLMRVRAMAKCWTTETIPEATDWRTGAITVDCQVGDAVSCTCFSDAWLML